MRKEKNVQIQWAVNIEHILQKDMMMNIELGIIINQVMGHVREIWVQLISIMQRKKEWNSKLQEL